MNDRTIRACKDLVYHVDSSILYNPNIAIKFKFSKLVMYGWSYHCWVFTILWRMAHSMQELTNSTMHSDTCLDNTSY